MNSVEEHRQEAPQTVNCMIVTVSDTRTEENDRSGHLMREMLEEAGYRVVKKMIVKDDYDTIRELIHEAAGDPEVEAVLLTGGTGISRRDTTYEAVASLLDKELPGFGEIFRYLSFAEDIGPAAILSRAIGGTVGNTAVFSMPGSTGAVKLALSRILVPELRHVKRELDKQG
ncbi:MULTISPECIES: MogA/MoaB family molybdenum cofactor biosynthesis protein [Paenibacillus]|uniref:Molybdenum cofactor biosynthesis protein B n=1 Tax=Paenibacillus campinasensis TaxID=66347 RepID=A0A268ES88_9BACL|nr:MULTISPECIES: MogA/MoaB family molybdenum cofactor biosynthesis protein [Paenibacillus]MUG66668.1 molybdenum cofactor biosynthesis protein [Paenibacillus campinasensis]PAD75989.1 molybdenum cofactor biosynthesis protein [Paenibacillus campinasensis]PAK50562.1 molybdenum cofactor biosynthesis protein [Paenibacillus sp. 7541]